MKRFEIFFGLIKIPTDLIMTVLGFFAAYRLRLITAPIEGIAKPIDYSTLPTLNEYLHFSFPAAIALIIVFAIGHMYTLKSTQGLSKEIGRSIVLVLVWIMLLITYFFFTRTFPFSRLAILYSWFITLLFLIFGRSVIYLIRNLFLNIDIGKRRLLFIGNNSLTKEIALKLSGNPGYKIIGAVGKHNKKDEVKILGTIENLERVIKKNKIDDIIQTELNLAETENENILELCDIYHINYRFVPDLIEMRRTNISTETLGSIPIISLLPTPLDGWGKVLKRGIDVIGSTFGMIVLSPVFLLTAIAIKLDSKGPIFFSKLDNGKPTKRVGQRGKLFKFYKFRSMQPNTDKLRYSTLAQQNTRKNSPLVKIKNDPRITSVGRFIRKYSIDELPQLWSVLIGDLSLVGPRPHLPEEVAKYEKHHHFVLTIKPGLTGLAQISGRSDLDFEEEVKLDRYYIENWSVWQDFRIIFKTISVVLKGYQE